MPRGVGSQLRLPAEHARRGAFFAAALRASAFVWFAACPLSIASVAATSSAARPQEELERTIERVERGLVPRVRALGRDDSPRELSQRMRELAVPGLGVAVIEDFRVSWTRSYGVREAGGSNPVTAETLFQAASLSKPVVAAAAMRLAAAGKLDLDQSVNERLVSWKIPDNEFTRGRAVLLRHLLSHSAGCTNGSVGSYERTAELPTLIACLNGTPPSRPRPVVVDYEPGSRWRYSGGGYSVLQQLLIDVSGKPFVEVMREQVLEPLGMRHSTFAQPLPEALAARAAAGHDDAGKPLAGKWQVLPEAAAGGLWSTPPDLARFLNAWMQSHAARSEDWLEPSAARAMATRQAGSWGLGFELDGEGETLCVRHGGSNAGYRSYLVAFPARGQGAVVMTNGDEGSELAREIVRALARENAWPDDQRVVRELAPEPPVLDESWVGDFEYAPGWVLHVSLKEGKLHLGLNEAPATELLAESGSRFFTLANTDVEFARDGEGRVVELRVTRDGESAPTSARRLP